MADNQKILVIEDDPAIAEAVAIQLGEDGYAVEISDNGASGLERALAGAFQLLIIDLGLPQLGGMEVCRRLRERGTTTPILMLTSRSDEVDKVLGLQVGADDYMTKPFSVRELSARVQALLRRSCGAYAAGRSETLGEHLRAADLEIDVARRTVARNGEIIELTATEFDLLLYLASNPERVFSREELLETVWGYTASGYDTTVSTHVSRLRAKIEPDAEHPTYIKTVWGVGYKFVGGGES